MAQPQQMNVPTGGGALGGQNPYTIDYLNQIAPKQKQPFFDGKMKALFGLLIVALVAGLFMILSGGARSDSSDEAYMRMYLRIQKTNEIVKKYNPRIRNSKLQAISSGLGTSLSSDENKMKNHMELLELELPKVEKNKAAPRIIAETDKEAEDLDKLLDDAYLNATLDRVFTREITYQLEVLSSALKNLTDRRQDKATIDLLESVHENIKVTIVQLEDYSKNDS